MGLKSFLVTDSGEEVEIPQHYRKAEKRLKKLQRSLSRKKKGSNRRKKGIKRFAKAHLKFQHERREYVTERCYLTELNAQINQIITQDAAANTNRLSDCN